MINQTREMAKVTPISAKETFSMEAKVKAAETGIEIARDVCSLLLFAVNVHIEGKQLQQHVEASWEDIRQRIAIIDAEAAAEIIRLAQSLEKERETTKKLQMITNLIVTQPHLPEEICKGLRAALENLTQRGET